MRIVFMGTPDFAVPSLERLIQAGHNVCLAVTQPDKPVGRKQIPTAPPVKRCAVSNGIEVFQPDSLKNPKTGDVLASVNPDLIVVAAYGKILPKSVLERPRFGCVNVHASLLPAYRGAAPVQWAMINGERAVGVTTMQMNEGLDTGDILLQQSREMPQDLTAGELLKLLASDGADLLVQTVQEIQTGTLTPVRQPERGSYAPMLSKADSPLDFSLCACAVHHRVMGLSPWPAATCRFHGKLLKIFRTAVGTHTGREPGTVCDLHPLSVACGDGISVQLLEVQAEGKQKMPAQRFVNGSSISLGERME